MKLLDDLPAFDMAAYASEAANARNAGVELPANLKMPRPSLKRESPNGFPIQNPWLSVFNSAHKQLLQLSAEFSRLRKLRNG